MNKTIIGIGIMFLLILVACSGSRYTVTGIVTVQRINYWWGSQDNVTVSKEFGNYSFITSQSPPMIQGGNYTLILRPNGDTYDIVGITEN